MDLDAPISIASVTNSSRTGATILCCNCGAPIDGTASAGALCYDCIKSTIDISAGIQREATLHTCRDCDRWLLPPNSWVRITDARFIWTEPHSRRVKVKVTVQDEVAEGVLLQQSFEVVYIVAHQQCKECQKSYTANIWRAAVQLRQKVTHKRTFLLLEQLILKHQAHRDAINIKEERDGIDFYFAQKNQAEAFINFLKSVVPVNSKDSRHLISSDTQSGNKSYKYSYSVEIVPICRDDLVALPLKIAKSIGNISPLVICHRIGTSVNFLDPNTLQTADISAEMYWRAPFAPLAGTPDMVEFIVMDIEPAGIRKGKWLLSEVIIARASDLGVNDQVYFARTHFGNLLHPGDSVLGYMITGGNYNSEFFDNIEASKAFGSTIPDVIIVKKHYPNKRRNKKRNWKLKRMNKDEGDLLPKAADQERMEAEYEMFLRDVEEDEELRAALALYKNTKKRQPQDADAMSVADTEMTTGEDEDNGPKIDMDELLDDFDEMGINDRA
ncbi:NMD3 family-domain-containing protein [Bombardia bombarda]|uniref:60S ribosomal export protein NMD3 n=1 Tax=Bombardia bombarda TaxID=252184 RepID=A0AA39WU59_9PEZI|nr:NMD3 family-domain-containing protein [Bombardia bombarda]